MMATLHPQTMLQQMDVAQLLALVRDEAQCHHDGHFTVLAFTTEFKVAFDTPSALEFGTVGYIQVQTMPGFPTKAALIHALLSGKTLTTTGGVTLHSGLRPNVGDVCRVG